MQRSFRTPGVPVVPILAMLVCLGLMLYLPVITWIRFVIWLVLGIAVYFLYGVHHSRLARVAREEVISEKETVGSD
nr:amino acid permease C-terminal domain-containing protein [Ktedonobacter sp. SOSP1-52]